MLTITLSGVFVFAAWSSGQAAIADFAYSKNTLEALERSVKLAPDNATFRALLAEHLEGIDRDPKPQLVEITKLDPLDSQYWIRRAFRAEIEGDYAQAESLLLQATQVDHKASPRWALMNFYFRRGRDAEFWSWVTKALSMSDSSVNAIFRLAWERSDNNSFIASHIPDRPDLITQYFYFLAETNRLDQAGEIAIRAVERAPETAFPAFVSYCSRYADSATSQALTVWNTLCKRKALPFKPLDPSRGAILTNADYSLDPTEKGFDWRPRNVDGVLLERGESGSGIQLELSGNQPEDCTLLIQILPTVSGKTYELAWTSSAGPGQTVSGLAWEVTGKDGTLGHGAIGEPSGAAGTLTFHPEGDSVRLLLRYRRPLGSVRARGTVTIHGLRTRVLP